MRTKAMFLALTIGWSAGADRARAATPGPLIVKNLAGNLHIEQGVPCAADVDETTPVTGGRMLIAPPDGLPIPGGRRFTLLSADVQFAGFTIHRSCLGFDETRAYEVVRVQVEHPVSFDALPYVPGVYVVAIPRERVSLVDVTVVNGELSSATRQPIEDVTGILDLAQGALQMKVVVGTRVRFRAGCIAGACIIDEEKDGTLTANLSGTISLPDTDGDGVPDGLDVCPLVANRDQGPVESPEVRGPANLTVASCAERRIGPVIAVDVCRDLPVTVTNDAPDSFRPGPNVVIWTVEDAAGQVVTRRQTVTVNDKTVPAWTSLPIELDLGDCGPVALDVPTAVDDCGGTPVIGNDAPREFLAGSTVVRWTATDPSGNQALAEQTVNVADRVAPDVACVPSADPDEGGEIGFYRVSARDACDVPAIRLGAFALADGEVIRITYSREPGIELLGISRSGVRHFRVGRGEQVIQAMDRAGNADSASCGALRDGGLSPLGRRPR